MYVCEFISTHTYARTQRPEVDAECLQLLPTFIYGGRVSLRRQNTPLAGLANPPARGVPCLPGMALGL